MSRRLLLTDCPWGDAEIERGVLEPKGVEIIVAPAKDESTLIELARDADAIATCWAKVTAPVIEAAARCRLIARMGIGLDNIDLQAAERRKIVVTNVPDYCVTEVADHALALLLASARNVAFHHWNTKQGVYDLQAGPKMNRLGGMRLGLLGFGRIAREVHQRARAFGLDVQASTPSGDDYGTGCRMVSLKELLSTSDFLSLHAPLTAETRQVLNRESLRMLKPTAVVINTSRGGLIDHEALWEALRNGRLGGAALDVFDPEPPDLGHPLFADERVIATPHAAFVSEESLADLRTTVAGQVLDVFAGRTPKNVVNGG
ncbi:MAG: C-terminal binding protein [Planctomyces sp.]|nr:C-terminal binding protein [Planctomyces sp.]